MMAGGSPARTGEGSSFYPVCFAVDQRPALDGTPVAGLPVGKFGFQDEAGIECCLLIFRARTLDYSVPPARMQE